MSEKEKKQQLGAPHNPLEFVDVRFDDYSDYTSACSSFNYIMTSEASYQLCVSVILAEQKETSRKLLMDKLFGQSRGGGCLLHFSPFFMGHRC